MESTSTSSFLDLAVSGRSFMWRTQGDGPDFAVQIGEPIASTDSDQGQYIVPVISVVALPVGRISSTETLVLAGFTLVPMSSGDLGIPQTYLLSLLDRRDLCAMGRGWSRAKLAAQA